MESSDQSRNGTLTGNITIAVPDSSSRSEPIHTLTIEAWVTRERTGQKEVVVSNWSETETEQSWLLYIDEDDRPCFAIRDNIRNDVFTVKAKIQLLERYRPYHLAAIYDDLPMSNDRHSHQILVDGVESSWRWVSKKEGIQSQLGKEITASDTKIHLHKFGEGEDVRNNDVLLLNGEHLLVTSTPSLMFDYGYADYEVTVERGINDTIARDHFNRTQIFRLNADSPGISVSPTAVSIGQMASGSSPFMGSINEVQIWPERLSVQQIHDSIEAARVRVFQDLQVLYTFQEGSGTTIRDVSGVGESLSLAAADGKAADWRGSPGALKLVSPNRLASDGPATKLIEAAKASNEITVEAWIVPPTKSATSLAPIVSLSSDPDKRNFTIGQYQNMYHARVQTSDTKHEGSDQPLVYDGAAPNQLVHLVYTRTFERGNVPGKARFFIDGKEVCQRKVNGHFSNWEDDFALTLGNFPGGDKKHAWMGTFHMVAIYSRALTPIEVFRNFEFGADSNLSPIVDTGPDQVVYLELEADNKHEVVISLTGKVVDDRLASDKIITKWTVKHGPSADVIFENDSSPTTNATFRNTGTYFLELAAFDGDPKASDTLFASEDLTITVIENRRPGVVITSPPDETVVKIPDEITLEAVVMDDGVPDPPGRLSLAWTKVGPEQDPAEVNFFSPDSEYSQASFSKPGLYHLRLSANDGHLEHHDEVVLHVYASPVIDIETEPIVNLPGSASLRGIILDDGLGGQPGTVKVSWEGLSGVVPAPADSPGTTADFSDKGMFNFRFTVDNGQLPPVSKEVTITVNKSPEITVASEPFVNLPARGTLNGEVLDDGLGDPSSGSVQTLWMQVSGPGSALIDDEKNPITTVEFPEKGIYQFQFSVDNNHLPPVSRQLTIVVNKSPVITARLEDEIITLPETARLIGELVDDGFGDPAEEVLSHPKGGLVIQWTADGPGPVVYEDPDALLTSASFEKNGIYTLILTVDNGYLDPFHVQIPLVVNEAPVVDAGPDQMVVLPSTAQLSGIVTDDGLPDPPGAVTTAWEAVGGPLPLEETVALENPASPTTTGSFSTNGTYVLRLTAFDGEASTSDDMSIVVHQAPVIDAGPDQTIAFKTPGQLKGTIRNDGLGAPGAGIVTIRWERVDTSLPARDVVFKNQNALNTTVDFNKQGIYRLRLTVENGFLSSTDEVTFQVQPPGQQ